MIAAEPLERRRMWGRIAPLLVAAGVVACASAAPDQLAVKLEDYYAGYAIEEDGRCPNPEIAAVTRRKVLARSADQTTIRVRYSYFDATAGGPTDWERVLQVERTCTGFAERDFTLARTELGYRVVAMSGPRREQP